MTNENETAYRALVEGLSECITDRDRIIERVLRERLEWERRALQAEGAIQLLRRARVGSQSSCAAPPRGSSTSVSADGPMATPQGDR